jgi:cell division protein FtsQ
MFNIFDNVKFINRLSYLIGGLAVFILLFSLVDYGINNWFTIDKVTITGDMEHVDQKQLTDTTISAAQGNLFTLSLNNMQAQFLQIPWVKHIIISRNFPNDVMVLVSEYTAIAHLGNDRLISADGKIFNGVASESLPVFDTKIGDVSEALTDYQLIGRIFKDRGVDVERIYINGFGITKLYFSNDLQVVLCGTEIELQLKLLDKYWTKLYTTNPGLNYVNMCYKNALAINAINKPLGLSVESSVSRKGK